MGQDKTIPKLSRKVEFPITGSTKALCLTETAHNKLAVMTQELVEKILCRAEGQALMSEREKVKREDIISAFQRVLDPSIGMEDLRSE